MIQEIKQLKLLEERMGIKVPLPNFFYVEKYGRNLVEQMEYILTVIGRKEWFLFSTDCRFKEGGLLHNFVIELEKHANLGKEYTGCVLIELSEDILQEEEFETFLNYLKLLEDKNYFLFTMKESQNTVFVQECMEQYFFVRIIQAQKYSTLEQWEEIRKVCEEYQFEIENEAEKYMKVQLTKREWKEEEQVLCRLRNVTCSMVYENMVEAVLGESTNEEKRLKEDETTKNELIKKELKEKVLKDNELQDKELREKEMPEKKPVFTLQMAQKMIRKMEPEHKKRNVIGFCVEEIGCA